MVLDRDIKGYFLKRFRRTTASTDEVAHATIEVSINMSPSLRLIQIAGMAPIIAMILVGMQPPANCQFLPYWNGTQQRELKIVAYVA